jgi:hypothetical protein
VLGWRGLDGGGEVVEVLWLWWVAFGSFGVFALMVFWVLEVGKEVWRDDVAVVVESWCFGGSWFLPRWFVTDVVRKGPLVYLII